MNNDKLMIDLPKANAGNMAGGQDTGRVVSMEVDKHVGRRIRGKRRAMGLSEADLAKTLAIDSDRIVAYEAGAARVPAEHLVKLCEYFNVRISYFFPAAPQPSQ
jgi:ribosome-binding protein aMBF1 (putative translation factor)